MSGLLQLTHYKRFTLLLLLCVLGKVSAQYQIPFVNYTMKEGLVQNQVRDICQDSKGYIWIATAGGVLRFDGKNFRNFTVSDGLPVNTVTALLVDRKDRIWMTTYGGGLTVFDGKSFHTYMAKDGLVTNSFNISGFEKFLIEDSQGNIWCRTNDEGISVVEKDTVITYNVDNGLVSNAVNCFIEDRQGRMLCGTKAGLSVIEHGQITNYTFGLEPSANNITGIAMNQAGEIWIVVEKGCIAQFIDGIFKYYTISKSCKFVTAKFDSHNLLWITTANDGIYTFADQKFSNIFEPEYPVIKLFEDSRNGIWLQTQRNGIYHFDHQTHKYYNTRNGLVDDLVTCIFEDEEGNIWIGTNSGISMYGKIIFEILTTESGLPNNHIISVAADRLGNIWCSPDSRGIMKFDGRQMVFYESSNKGTATNSIVCMEPVKDKLLLGSMGAGTGYFENGRFVFSPIRGEEVVYKIVAVNDHEYWAASSKGLLHVCDGNGKYYTVDDGLIDDLVYFLARDSKNRIWCTTASGLSVFDGDKFTNYTIDNGLPNNSCTDIAIDKNGIVWLGTENGLCKITETDNRFDFKVYTVKDGLADNSINMVHADQSDRLWVGHVKGLNTVDLKTGDIRHYAKEDGYMPMDCYMGAATTDAKGNVWIGTIAGLVKYNPEADQKRTSPPRTYISSISLVDGEDILQYADSVSSQNGLPANLVLPHNQNGIRIDWIGIHFTIPAKNRYRFILEGHEKTWHEMSTETSREYQLPPGDYTFKVMACNNDGIWNTDAVTYSFVVRPPWWATHVAYVVYVVVAIILIFLYVRWRERKLVAENRLLEEKVHERTIEIEIQNQNIIEINKILKEHQEELIVQRDMAAGQRDQIAEQRREIMDSIHYAKRIQKAIMPGSEVMHQIVPDHFLFFRPRDVVSGDYYWATRKGNKSVIVAADCTGHGVPGALMSMIGISFLNEIVLKQEMGKASDILNELRTKIKTILSQTGAVGEQRDGMDVALCIIDYEAMELQYAGAYNSLYVIRNGELIEYKADKMPVGIHIGEEKNFTNHVVSLEDNDMLYIFSDGYIDQFGGENSTKFKTLPFKKLLVSVSELPVEQQKEKLMEAHENWKGEEKQIDDMIVIGIRIDKL